jgi:hypothetical protein
MKLLEKIRMFCGLGEFSEFGSGKIYMQFEQYKHLAIIHKMARSMDHGAQSASTYFRIIYF